MMSGGAEGLGAVVVKCTARGKSTLFISTFPASPHLPQTTSNSFNISTFLSLSNTDFMSGPGSGVIAGNCETVNDKGHEYLIKYTTNIPPGLDLSGRAI